MQDSILMTIRKLVCGNPYADHFDTDLLVHINACFSILNQLGVGPENGFVVTDETQSWSSYIADNYILNMVKTYVTLKVKKIFDPPLTSSVLEAMDKDGVQLVRRHTGGGAVYHAAGSFPADSKIGDGVGIYAVHPYQKWRVHDGGRPALL